MNTSQPAGWAVLVRPAVSDEMVTTTPPYSFLCLVIDDCALAGGKQHYDKRRCAYECG